MYVLFNDLLAALNIELMIISMYKLKLYDYVKTLCSLSCVIYIILL